MRGYTLTLSPLFTVRELLERQGVEVQYTTQAAFATLMREDHQRWVKLVKDAGINLR